MLLQVHIRRKPKLLLEHIRHKHQPKHPCCCKQEQEHKLELGLACKLLVERSELLCKARKLCGT
jgi:hypothetical protein